MVPAHSEKVFPVLCRPLAVEAREPFLLPVAQTIAGLDEHADGAVFRICRELQCRFFDPPQIAAGAPGRGAKYR